MIPIYYLGCHQTYKSLLTLGQKVPRCLFNAVSPSEGLPTSPQQLTVSWGLMIVWAPVPHLLGLSDQRMTKQHSC